MYLAWALERVHVAPLFKFEVNPGTGFGNG